MHYTIDQCEDIVDRAIASENVALQARLDAAHAREDELASVLTEIYKVDIRLPFGFLKEVEEAISRHQSAKEQRNKQ